MKARNLLMSLLAVCMLCLGNIALAADDGQGDQVALSEMTVNINEADAETLANVLVGVGPSRAQAIVNYREKNGKFYSAEELSAVRGIGRTTIKKNAARIVVN